MSASPPTYDLQYAVAAQFASRPTLRQVAGEQIMKVIVRHYPLVGIHRPQMTSAQPLFLITFKSDGWTTEPLVDALLQAMIDGRPVDFGGPGDCRLSLQPLRRFYTIEDSAETAEGDVVEPGPMADDFNILLAMLPYHFQQALIDYWNGDAGFARERWLQQVLRASLMYGLDDPALDTLERACLRDLLKDDVAAFSVQAIRVNMQHAGVTESALLPGLLLRASDEVRTITLWCSPNGEARSFTSLAEFGVALQRQMACRYRFDDFSWVGYEADGDVFALQTGLLLEGLFERLGRIRISDINSVDELQQAYNEACDPSVFFAARADASRERVALKLPRGLREAGKDAQTAYLQAMIDLTLLQSGSDGEHTVDDVEDLHAYATRRLREELRLDHPLDGDYSPDDLLLTLDTFANDGHGLGFPQKIDSKVLTLTELAIGRVSAAAGGVVTHITHRSGLPVMSWMNADYIRLLIERIDLGAAYPVYVHSLLADDASKPARIAGFARQWRVSLLFDAARARTMERLDAPVFAALARFCRGGQDSLAGIRFAPLSFRRSPSSKLTDKVHGVFVIEVIEQGRYLLYCPLHSDTALTQYTDAQALLKAISEPGELQDVALTWLDQSQRAVYDHGGFKEPHLPHWVFDPYAPLERPRPVQLALQFWATTELDRQLFEAKLEMLLELSNRTALSNSDVRWGVVSAFSWELLNMVMPVLPGPVVSVAWLYLGIRALTNDVAGLSSQSTAEKVQAVVDILNNTLMLLIHAQIPKLADHSVIGAADKLAGLPVSDGMPPEALPAPVQRPVERASNLQTHAATRLDFSWRGNGGLNGLTQAQRHRLREMASAIPADGRQVVSEGAEAGLTAVGTRRFVVLGDESYRVESVDGNFYIVGPDQTRGPRLKRGGNGWELDTRLQGGSGREVALARLRQKLEGPVSEALTSLERNLRAADGLTTSYDEVNTQLSANQARIGSVELLKLAPRPTDPVKLEQFEKALPLYELKLRQLVDENRALRIARIGTMRKIFDCFRQAEKDVITLLDNPIYQRTSTRPPQDRLRLISLRQRLIGFGMFIIDEVISTGEFTQYDSHVAELNAASTPERRQVLYAQYCELLEKIVREQPAIIEISSELDRLLAVSDIDMHVQYEDTNLTVAQVIELRKTSTIAIRFFQAMSLVELALQLEMQKNTVQRFEIFREALASQRLRVAANSHQLTLFCELPVTERIELLQSAWDEYLAAILNCERIKKLGGTLVDTQRLEAYQEQMVQLKAATGEALVEAMREQVGGQAQTNRRRVYTKKLLQVAHTRAGQIVIGTDEVIDGRSMLVVRATFATEPSHIFQRQGDVWVESIAPVTAEPSSRAATPESEQNSKALAEGMLEQNQNVITQARELVVSDADDRGLIAMLDGQIREVQELREQLLHAEPGSNLLKRLEDAAATLQEEKRASLIELYSKTNYPSARGLTYLNDEKLLKVTYLGPRMQVSDGYLDEYRIDLLENPDSQQGRPLWAAHFHFADSQAAPTAFGKGHLKLWRQRKMGYREQMRAAEAGQMLRIFRGDLSYAQIKEIIPFDEY